ncbi:MAG: DNA helicase UvrD [Parcubacteria group bacterium]|nr:DNA helicase UvrD [Parcubacteria group bacterium]
MRFIADFHIHSPYARAVSKQMTFENLDKWGRIKGIQVLGTGDFTHPKWFKEIKTKLIPAENGLYKLNPKFQIPAIVEGVPEVRFILSAEVSSIYSKKGKVRRIHNLIFFPSVDDVEKFNILLGLRGNLASDGRPIVGVGSKELLKMALSVNPEVLFIPAHAWTPWFSIFGSKSGFDTIEECFDELTPYIYSIETGISSDPAMNWRVSQLDNIALISNSDSHSLVRIGREANIFDTELSYKGIFDAIRYKDPKKFLSTIEYFPEEGRYHYDGHRACGVSFHPDQSKKTNFLCPHCSKPLTIGVMARVEELADRPQGEKPSNAIPFKNMVPLDQIIGDALDLGVASKAVWKEYDKLIKNIGNEFQVLFESTKEKLASITTGQITEAIMRVRDGKLNIEPGYDGEYGKVQIFVGDERDGFENQTALPI